MEELKLTHTNEAGKASMVDVGGKSETRRVAMAESVVRMQPSTLKLVIENGLKKGDVLSAARIAGIQAAKRTDELIPLCHQIRLDKAIVEFEIVDDDALRIITTASATDRTGVEMEALVAASVAALTIYDMIKAVEKSAVIESTRLLSKSGGKSGDYAAE
ncbi:MAG: cyclic pyranopterin monophosphate synthase MoaC [Planctomycetes bacterium]|nr:cyclic pyranopterin monophosphate synthase MoaC [Planctomycetota bacterium]